MESLFEEPGEPGSLYEAIRSGSHHEEIATRRRVDELWLHFAPHADRQFAKEFRAQPHSRYWEMYLTCVLLGQQREVECKKPGPDILVREGRLRIWIEAVNPGPGVTHLPDSVRPTEPGVVFEYPEEQILLRYRSAIEEKRCKFDEYLKSGIVEAADARVVAVSAAGIPLAWLDHDPPDMVKAVLPFGATQLEIDTATGELGDEAYSYRPAIRKASGKAVATDVFLDPDYSGISAVIFSNANISNPPPSPGHDLVLVHNPKACVCLQRGWLGVGREYEATVTDRGLELTNFDAASSTRSA